MQKIIVQNFNGIAYAEVEIKNFLVLIGEMLGGQFHYIYNLYTKHIHHNLDKICKTLSMN